MDVRIGLVDSPQPIEVELPDDTDAAKLKTDLAAALVGDDQLLWITDKKGNEIAIVGRKITYVSFGSGADKGRIGFGA